MAACRPRPESLLGSGRASPGGSLLGGSLTRLSSFSQASVMTRWRRGHGQVLEGVPDYCPLRARGDGRKSNPTAGSGPCCSSAGSKAAGLQALRP